MCSKIPPNLRCVDQTRFRGLRIGAMWCVLKKNCPLQGILALLNINTGVEITEIEAGLTFLLLLLFTADAVPNDEGKDESKSKQSKWKLQPVLKFYSGSTQKFTHFCHSGVDLSQGWMRSTPKASTTAVFGKQTLCIIAWEHSWGFWDRREVFRISK